MTRPTTAAAALTSITLSTSANDVPYTDVFDEEQLLGPKLLSTTPHPPFPPAASRIHTTNPSDIISTYLIGKRNMSTLYMLPDPYYNSFDEIIDLRKFDLNKHCTAGLCLRHSDNRLFLGGMTPGTPGSKNPRWRSRIKGAWLIKVGDAIITSIEDAQLAFAQESTRNPGHTVSDGV
jgi:hypothetical protein